MGNSSGGQREFVAPLTRAACAVGIDALFTEVHPNPAEALSDGANSLDFKQIRELLLSVKGC
jgi:2-dehydro-3-deoxyphosphooctonate aldolase (KDO 8-P synthase)